MTKRACRARGPSGRLTDYHRRCSCRPPVVNGIGAGSAAEAPKAEPRARDGVAHSGGARGVGYRPRYPPWNASVRSPRVHRMIRVAPLGLAAAHVVPDANGRCGSSFVTKWLLT